MGYILTQLLILTTLPYPIIDFLLQKRLEQLHALWDQLLFKLKDKGKKLGQALKLLQFIRQCDEVLYWIRDKVR